MKKNINDEVEALTQDNNKRLTKYMQKPTLQKKTSTGYNQHHKSHIDTNHPIQKQWILLKTQR